MAIEFRLLGEVEVRVDGRPIPIRGIRLQAILATLLVEANRPVPRDTLLDRIWGGGRLPARPSNAVQSQITLLRRALAPTDASVTWQPTGYRIAVDEMTIDLFRFRDLLRQARAADQQDEQAVSLFEQALSLWHGEPFAAMDMPWFATERATLARERQAARLDLTDARLRCGQHAAVLTALNGQADEYPLDERIAGQLMLALYRSGRPSDALEHYQRLRRRLADELGTDPSGPLQQLHQQILTTDPALADAAPAAARRPSVITHGLPPRNPFFTGRDAVLRRIHDHLHGGDTAVGVVPLHGMGGVGKTQLAVEYAYRYAGDYRLVCWVSVENATLATAALTALAGELGLSVDGPPAQVVSRLWTALAQRSDWLLIYDNVDDPTLAAVLHPPSTGRLLITGRSPVIGRLSTVVVEVAQFEREESVRLLMQRCPSLTAVQADRIAVAVQDLPLAIEQAGCFLNDSGLDVTDYLDLLATRPGQAGLADPTLDRHPGLVAVVAAGRSRLGVACPPAAALLDQMSFLAPEPLTLTPHSEKAGVRIGDIAMTADVMRHLSNLALVHHTGTTIQLHRLVHALLLARVRAAGEYGVHRLAAYQLLATAEPDDPYDPSTWPVYAMLTPHVQAVSGHGDVGVPGSFRVLTLNVLRYLHASGQYVEQRLLAARARRQWIDTLGPDDADSLRVATNLATALFELREFGEARDIGQDVLERTRRVMGVDHPAALSSATNLAQILTELGEYTAACEIGQDTVERFRRVLGPDHLYTLGASDNLASGLFKLGDYKAAREVGEDTYRRTCGVLGPDHPHTLGSATNLVMALTELGDHEAARDLGVDTLERARRILGPDHPHTRRCAANVAALTAGG